MAITSRLILSGIDLAPLLTQLDELGPALWNTDPCWMSPAAPYCPDNIILRYDARHLHFSQWDRIAFDVLRSAHTIVFALTAAVRGKVLGRVGITRMNPGDVLAPHTDAQRPIVFERYQIPLAVPEGVMFVVDGEPVIMRPGEAWWFDKTVTHSVENRSAAPRLAMIVEIHS